MRIDACCRPRRSMRIACVVMLLIASWRAEARADCPVEPWLSNDAMMLALGEDSEDGVDGIGGSGFAPGDPEDEDGIGGSGIFGTVTGFASVCVNGGRIRYDDDLTVNVDGTPGDLSDLAVGHVIRARVMTRADGLFAAAIDLQHALVGPVTGIGSDYVEVMGVRLRREALGADLQRDVEDRFRVGVRLAISGLWRPDGRLVASRVDRARPDVADLVRGEVEFDEVDGIRIGAIVIEPGEMDADSSSHSVNPDQRSDPGRRLFRGRWNEDRKRFEADRSMVSPQAEETLFAVDIEGYVRRDSADELRVGGLRLSVEAGDPLGAIEVGDRVRIRAVRSRPDQPLRPTSIVRVPERPMLRSLDRTWQAPRPNASRKAPAREEPSIQDRPRRRERPRNPDIEVRPRRPDRMPDRPDVVRPDRPVRPPSIRDVITPRDDG